MADQRESPPYEEIEVKIRIDDPDALRRRLLDMGAGAVRERHLEDNVLFDDPDMLITRKGCLLRIRTRPGEGILTFKGQGRVEGGAKVRSEREVRVEDPGTLRAILEGVGLASIYRYQKYRTEFELDGVQIAVDELPFGNFLELEGPLESIGTVAGRLGFSSESFLSSTYRNLHQEHSDRTGEPMDDLLFPEGVTKGP
jgi:adenylate cyclase class 2